MVAFGTPAHLLWVPWGVGRERELHDPNAGTASPDCRVSRLGVMVLGGPVWGGSPDWQSHGVYALYTRPVRAGVPLGKRCL